MGPHEDLIETILVLLFFIIPVVGMALVARVKKSRKRLAKKQHSLEAVNQQQTAELQQVKAALAASQQKNQQLEERLENLETIVTSVDWPDVTDPKTPA